MNTKTNVLIVLALSAALPAAAAKISVPLAPVVTYGLIRDEYGAPMTKNSSMTVKLYKDGDDKSRIYSACDVGDAGIAGMNYRLPLEIDSSGPTRDYAVIPGVTMRIKAFVGGAEEILTPVSTFVCPAMGTKQRIDYAIGTDADGDGMPDDWEEWVLDLAGRDSSAAAIAAFKPGDDADGDGMTNLAEFLAGTDPFLATDLLKIETFRIVPGSQRAELTFYTVPDRKYRVLMADSLANPNWTPVPTTRTDGGELVYENYAGNGHLMTVYTDANLTSMFFRVAVN